MTTQDILELAARVEAAAGPDRLIDAETWRLINGAKVYEALTPQGEVANHVPAYTASLDDARAGVPLGWHVGILTECGEDCGPYCCLTQNEEPCRDVTGVGASMALALTAAALKASAHTKGKE